jgi:hypothetical protein
VCWIQRLVQMEIMLFTPAGQNAVSFCKSYMINLEQGLSFALYCRKDEQEVFDLVLW